MDDSKQYIEMCEKAEEIQALCEFNDGEFFAVDGQFAGHKFEWVKQDKEIWIWLPRQDQLQEMVEGTHIEKFGRVYRAVENMELYPSGSMEQLWLAFVMREKWQKIWVNNDWIKETS